jgi:NAD-dependent SIR2 family protein deacetylase
MVVTSRSNRKRESKLRFETGFWSKNLADLPSNHRQLCDLIAESNRIVVVTGAGISVACGLPDFRSLAGLYKSSAGQKGVKKQTLFDWNYIGPETRKSFLAFHGDFMLKCRSAWSNLSVTHKWLYDLVQTKKVVSILDQNIDGLLARAGLEPPHLVSVHGSYGLVRCTVCGFKTESTAELESAMRRGKVDELLCSKCQNPAKRQVAGKRLRQIEKTECGLLIPDIVYYHDPLPMNLDQTMRDVCRANPDLVLVMGTTLATNDMALAVRDLLRKSRCKSVLLNIGDIVPKLNFTLKIQERVEDVLPNICLGRK